jgi:hypothetical protein
VDHHHQRDVALPAFHSRTASPGLRWGRPHWARTLVEAGHALDPRTGLTRSYARKEKVIIGTFGSKSPIEFIVEQYNEDPNQLGRGQYISVESRKTKTIRFLARLEEDKRQSVRAAYESGLVYVRLALLVSSGREEKKIVSTLGPFSVEARKQHDAAVANMTISI